MVYCDDLTRLQLPSVAMIVIPEEKIGLVSYECTMQEAEEKPLAEIMLFYLL